MENKSLLAEVLGVSRRSLYYKPIQHEKDWKTKQLIEGVLREHNTYGHKRIALELGINKKRVLRVMKLFGIKPYKRTLKKRYKAVKQSKGAVIANLLIKERPQGKNDVWASDFTYVKFQSKWYYIATIIDIYTREIVGMSIANHHRTELVVQALHNAILHNPPPRIIHSDQGSEYHSQEYRDVCHTLGILQSMSHPGCPWENGYQESFYKGFKLELGDISRFETIGELVACIYKTINYYNTKRIHSALRCSPKEFALRLSSK